MEARAARFHQAVDLAIVLSNDGVIRWLGDPVARLSPGADLLNPSAVILADESLPAQSRETAKARIELWIAATTRRLLGPLFALEAIQEGPELVQNLAHDLARSLGILEREPIRAQVNALAQNDRAELRKQGVRFGAYYLFVPGLIKPAPRNLALQLWGLQARGDVNDLLRSLGPVASSGRTSLPWDSAISKDGYRVAGYRPCGERAVRVDVVERLAGMVRAATAGEAPGAASGLPSRRPAKGFVVSGEMTSLTGCSGDHFASILRSMGFRPVEMRRSDFFAAAQADGSPEDSASAAPDEGQAQTADDQPSSPAADAEEAAPDAILASPAAEPLVDGDAADMAPAPISPDPSAEPLSGDAVDMASAPISPDPSAEPLSGDAVDVAPAPTSAYPSGEPLSGDAVDMAPAPTSAYPSAELLSGDAVEASPPQTPESSSEPAKNIDMIVVWRPDRRRTSPDRQRERKQSKGENPGRPDPRGEGSDRAPKQARSATMRQPGRPNSA